MQEGADGRIRNTGSNANLAFDFDDRHQELILIDIIF